MTTSDSSPRGRYPGVDDLRQGGILSQRLPGYKERPAQIEMALTVAEALATSKHALMEAPTGVGKSLAYLVLLVRSGKVAIISTAKARTTPGLCASARRCVATIKPLAMTKQDIAQHKMKKTARIPELRKALAKALADTAASPEMAAVPPEEQIVLVAFLSHFPWEDISGLPSQIMVQGSKKKLECQNVRNCQNSGS